MKRLTSLLMAVLMVVTMVSTSLLSVAATEATSVSLSAPAEVKYTGNVEEDSFQVEANLALADGSTAIAGYEVKLTWDPTRLTFLEIVRSGEGLADMHPEEGAVTIAVANVADVLSGKLFYASFAPLAEGDATVSVEVLSMATSTGLIDATGSTVTVTAKAPAVIYETPEEIVKAAYELESGEYLSDSHVYQLTGEIISVDSAYSEQYKNVTVTMTVDGLTDYPIQCFRMKGEGADAIKIGDTITVSGKIKRYNQTVEFDSGCILDAYVPGEPEVIIYETPEEIVNAAYELENGEYLSDGHIYQLTGEIISVDSAYSEQYGNVTVTIVVNGMTENPIQCFRLKGEGADVIKIGDTITVSGKIKRYNSTIEFDTGCVIDSYVPGTPDFEIYETPEEIVNAAYELDKGATLSGGHLYTLTGVITSIDTVYSEQYGNITVTIQVGDMTDKLIKCYRLKGEGAADLAVGDTITVEGVIKNYNGTVEFDAGCALLEVVKKPTYKFGDVDGDGRVGGVDYSKLKKYVLKTYTLSEEELSRSDINGDGKVTGVDYALLKRYVLKTWTPEA